MVRAYLGLKNGQADVPKALTTVNMVYLLRKQILSPRTTVAIGITGLYVK